MKIPTLTMVYYKYHENEWHRCQHCQVRKVYGNCVGCKCWRRVKTVNHTYVHLPSIFIFQEDKTL